MGELVGREMRSHVLVPRTGRLECREETIAVKRSMMLPRCHDMLVPPRESCEPSKLMRAVLVLMSKLMMAVLVRAS